MPIVSPQFDLDKVNWRRVTDPDCTAFTVDFEYSLLGYDIPTGRLDMLLRYAGSTKSVHRKKGDYALAPSDAHPHDEYGGANGGTVLLSMTATDGVLFEYFDESMENSWTVSIEQYVESWDKGSIHGARPAA